MRKLNGELVALLVYIILRRDPAEVLIITTSKIFLMWVVKAGARITH